MVIYKKVKSKVGKMKLSWLFQITSQAVNYVFSSVPMLLAVIEGKEN